MKYLFELSKEHKTLPKAEVLACLDAEEIDYDISESNEDILILETLETKSVKDKMARVADRLSFTFYIDEFLFSSSHSTEEIKIFSKNYDFNKKGSVAIRYKNRSKNIKSRPIVRILADSYTKNREVSLENPDNEIRGLITDSKLYVGLKNAEINKSQFEQRKVQYRPFFSPISLHPKIARALVNLSSVRKGETILDPFCGTGGILIEAGLIGAKLIGSDIEEKMIKGCSKTLDFFKINEYDLYCSDIGKIGEKIEKVDAIVTDLPYGKSTTTKGENMHDLYQRSFKSMSHFIKKEGKIVVGLSEEEYISLGQNHFTLIDNFEFKVHKSLNRYFVVYQN